MQSAAIHRQSELDDLINRLDLSLVEPDPDYDLDDELDSIPSPLDPEKEGDVAGNVKETLPSPSSTVATVAKAPPSINDEKQLADRNADEGKKALALQEQNHRQIKQIQQFQRQPSLPQPLQQVKQNQQLQRQPSLQQSTQQTKQSQQLQRQPSLQQPEQQPQQRTVGIDDDKKSAGRFDLFRKLRGNPTDSSAESRRSKRRKTLEQLKVDSLPQSFVAKYVGCKACRGLWGIQHTREPVDALVDDLRHLDRATGDRRDDLPLVRVDVTVDGIGIAVHPRNRSRRPVSDVGLLPLEFISYAVQDTRYSRIFAFVLVRELSSRARATECHAFLCDTPATARTLALSVALAFRTYEQKLAGKQFRFVVDLRWPDELESELLAARQTSGSNTKFHRAEFEV